MRIPVIYTLTTCSYGVFLMIRYAVFSLYHDDVYKQFELLNGLSLLMLTAIPLSSYAVSMALRMPIWREKCLEMVYISLFYAMYVIFI